MVRYGRLAGLDAIGCAWTGSLRWMDAGTVEADITADPSGVEGAFMHDADGTPTARPVRFVVPLSVVVRGDNMVVKGARQTGAVRAERVMTRRKRFDGADL